MRHTTAADITRINAHYHDKISRVYDLCREQSHPKVIALYQAIFDRIARNWTRSKRPFSILDVGCGTGFLEKFLEPNKNRIVGLDISKKLLTLAKRKFPSVDYRLQDIHTFHPSRRFDMVVECAVLHHLKDYETVLHTMMKFVKPGGVIFLGSEPNEIAYKFFVLPKHLLRAHSLDHRPIRSNKAMRKLEQFAEYHMYFRNGINPFHIKRLLLRNGFDRAEIVFSSREFFAGLVDRMNFRLVDVLPTWLMDATGPFSRVFHLVAYKNNPVTA